MFSGGIWNEHSYAEGVAACDGPLGPCRVNGGPTLATNGTTVSPGGAAAFIDAIGNRWIAYHAYNDPLVGWPYSRTLRLAHMNVGGNSVSFSTP